MRKVGIGANKEQADQTVPYAVHMEAVGEIERLQAMVTEKDKETERLQTENESLKAENESLKKDNLPKK